MKVVHISTYDLRGGAPRAAFRLNKGLRKLGHESIMFVAQGDNNDPSIEVFAPPMDLRSRILRRLRRKFIIRAKRRYRDPRSVGYERFSDDRTPYGDAPLRQLPPADVINLHWITDFIDYRDFFSRIPREIPVIWTIHDMNPFTGGCHYDDGCGKYTGRCGACPQLGSSRERDLSRQVWERKRSSLARVPPGQLHLVTPSQWMSDEVRRSTLLGRLPVSVIPNSVNIDDFSPRDRSIARSVLGLPLDANVILFVATSVTDKRKGLALLIKALAGLDGKSKLLLLSVGGKSPVIECQIPHLHLGRVANDRLLSLVYSAADVFVMPSIQDNLPNTVLESMACGTPVVGFAVGGIPDMVRSGVTGLLRAAQDVDALRVALLDLLRDPVKREEMAANCRRIGVERYALEVQARRYAELYQTILTRN